MKAATMPTETTDDPAKLWRRTTGRTWSGIRARLFVSFVLLLAVATAASVMVVRTILLHRLDERIDADLVQEARELQRLAEGNDPETGEPFAGDVKRIFDVFLERNIPLRYESQLSFVDGELYRRSRPAVPYRLHRDQDTVERWSSLTDSDRGNFDTPGGSVEYLAIPLRAGDGVEGIFVTAIFRDEARKDIDPAIAGAAGVGGVVLLIGSLLAWRLADRILTPVRRVSETARGISETDLSRRIEVEGNDEIAQLSRTFNEMLDRLQEGFETQRRFIDDAGHELRTPITIIQGQLDTLEDDPDERRRSLEIVTDELQRMNRFVDDLLVLARAERPDFLNLDLVDMGPLTEDLFSKAQSLGNHRWKLDEVARGRVVADRQRLTQAVMQLAENATRYTNGDGEIGLGSSVNDGEAHLWVRDSGQGIAPQEHEDIFDRFRRGTRTRRYGEGAGLGLSIVKAIAHAHHGRVEVVSDIGKGSRFTITVPIDQPTVLDRTV